jgi:hypothetical protein
MARLSRVKRATSIASTFAIALGIGFAMQYGDANAARYASDVPVAVRAPVLIVDYAPLTEMSEVALKPETVASGNLGLGRDVAVDVDSIKLVALVREAANAGAGAFYSQPQAPQHADCDIKAALAPDDSGSVLMTILSKCRTNAAFSVNHNGLTFTAQTDHKGMSSLKVPAMAVDAAFFITFEDGKSLATSTYAPDAELYNRVVFQWEGHESDYLHSTEAATSFGKIDRLGADVGEIPRFAEVYSFPAEHGVTDGLRGIDVVATVTESNCGQDLVAESFTIFPGIVDLTFKDILITLPDCHGIGDVIGLKKVLGEQTLAMK